MSLPVFVDVNSVEKNIVSDQDILIKREGKMFEEINLSLIKENTASLINSLSLKLLNALLAQSPELVVDTIDLCKQALKSELVKKDVALVFCNKQDDLFGYVLADGVMQLLVNGIYSFKNLLDDELYEKLLNLFVKEKVEDIPTVRYALEHQQGYMQNPKNRCIVIISELIKQRYDKTVNLKKSIQQYFMVEEESLFGEIEAMVRKGVS